MQIAIILIALFLTTAFLGMLYWMWKSRKGELNLSTNSWHFKLLHYMWDTETYEVRNACPYYWGLICSLIVLTPYLILRYLVVLPISKIPFNKIPKIKLPKLHIIEKINNKIPNITIPESKKQWFRLFYTKGKTIFLSSLAIFIVGIVLFTLFVKFPLTTALSILFVMIFFIFTLILHIVKDDWDKYHINHYENFFKGLIGIICIPFVIFWNIIEFLFNKIVKVYNNSCPPINWE